MLASRDIVRSMQVGMLVEQENEAPAEWQGPWAQFGHDRGLIISWQRSECYNRLLRTIDIEPRHLLDGHVKLLTPSQSNTLAKEWRVGSYVPKKGMSQARWRWAAVGVGGWWL